MPPEEQLTTALTEAFGAVERVVNEHRLEFEAEEVGVVTHIDSGIASVSGLPNVKAEELIAFPNGVMGMAFNLDPDEIGCVMLTESRSLAAGTEATPTHRVVDVPVGSALLGRVVSSLGEPMDDRGPIHTLQRRQVEQPAPAIMDRAPVTEPLQTGLKVVDATVPIGKGQRELILGDRSTGKTAIALDTILNQADKDVVCIYCAIGQRGSAVAKLIADLESHNAMEYCIVVVASGDVPPGQQYIAPYAATAMGEYLMGEGRDVLVVYDDLSAHAKAYRQMSLLLRRPPGREAYPGDIFYIHSRLLERATHLRDDLGGGSLTALPIVQTEAQNISAYIPTNIISITDGQIYLSPDLFQKGVLPAVDVGRSVSRVGGKAQLPAYKAIAGQLRLSYSQFQELETFARFGTRLDEDTRQKLRRGSRVRAALKQRQYNPVPTAEQVVVLLAASRGVFDDIPLEKEAEAEVALREAFREQRKGLYDEIASASKLTDEEWDNLVEFASQHTARFRTE